MQRHTREQILSKHVLPPASTRTKCECLAAIALGVLVVVRALASPATTLAVASTYVNDVKIIALFNFYMIPGIISCDEHVVTFGSGILGNIIMLHDNVTTENGDVSAYVRLFT